MDDSCAWVVWLPARKQTGQCIWCVSVSVARARRQPSWAVFPGTVSSLPHFFALLTKPWIIHQLWYQTNICATRTCKSLGAAACRSKCKGGRRCRVFRLSRISLWCSASLTVVSREIISIFCWICSTFSAFLCWPEMLIQRLYFKAPGSPRAYTWNVHFPRAVFKGWNCHLCMFNTFKDSAPKNRAWCEPPLEPLHM